MIRLSLALVVLVVACEEPAPPVAPSAHVEEAPPPLPELGALASPSDGHAKITVPEWNRARQRYEHTVSEVPAKLGQTEGATRIELGDSSRTLVSLTFYGASLAAQAYTVMPDSEETIAHMTAGSATGFIARMTRDGNIAKSASGTVTITSIEAHQVRGTYDIVVRGQLVSGSATLRGSFDARSDAQLDAFLEHQRGVSARLHKQR